MQDIRKAEFTGLFSSHAVNSVIAIVCNVFRFWMFALSGDICDIGALVMSTGMLQRLTNRRFIIIIEV